jgi:hypothetical protein
VTALIRPLNLSSIIYIAKHSTHVAGLEHTNQCTIHAFYNHLASLPNCPELFQIEPTTYVLQSWDSELQPHGHPAHKYNNSTNNIAVEALLGFVVDSQPSGHLVD